MKKNSMINDFKRVMQLMGKHKLSFFILIIFIEVPNAFINVGIAFGMKMIADYFTKGGQEYLNSAIIVAVTLLVLGCTYFPFIIYVGNKKMEVIMRDIKINLFKHLQKLPVSYFENNHSGNILTRVNKDTEAFYSVLDIIRGLGWSVISMAVIVPYVILMDWRFGLISLVASIAATIINIKYIIPMREKSKKIHDKTAVLAETITDNVTGFNVIKMYGLGGIFMEKFLKKLEVVVGFQFDRIKVSAIVYTSNIFISWANSGLLSVIGCALVFNGTIDVGILVGTVPVCNSIAFAIINFSSQINNVQKHFAGTDRLYELLNVEVEAKRYKTSGNSPDSGVCINSGKFGYTKDTPIIDGLNIDVKKGQLAALVGDSGGGKSTIIKLIMGMYEMWSGNMVIDGKGVNEYSLKELRDKVAYVPQDSYIFNGTIIENISYGNTLASMDEIIEAAKKANAHEFILNQKDGYNTIVGERGIKLSGGQRQRVAIARAIIKNAPILLLDEATSSLDSESEKLVQEAIYKLMENKTSVVVAHRLSTIKEADIIYYIKDGRVEESGNHAELIEKNGKYAELYLRTFSDEFNK